MQRAHVLQVLLKTLCRLRHHEVRVAFKAEAARRRLPTAVEAQEVGPGFSVQRLEIAEVPIDTCNRFHRENAATPIVFHDRSGESSARWTEGRGANPIITFITGPGWQ